MKKILPSIFALCLLFGSFSSCDNGSRTPEWNANPDEVRQLSKPSISGEAFYGYNYITWSAVPCKNYIVRIEYPDGTKKSASTNDTFLYDKVNNPGDYKYFVQAIAADDPIINGREIIHTSSDIADTTVRAKIPEANNFDYNPTVFDLGEKLTSDNVKIKYNESKGVFVVNFPAKSYLDYYINVCTDVEKEVEFGSAVEYNPIRKQESSTAEVYIPVTRAGSFNVYISASMYNDYFDDAFENSETEKLAKVNIEVPELSTTVGNYSTVFATYSNEAEGKSIISWIPAKNPQGDFYGINNYKVYKFYKNDYLNVSGEIKIAEDSVNVNGDTRYYIEDTVEDTKNRITYYVVLKSGNRYGGSSTTSLQLTPEYADYNFNQYGSRFIALDDDYYANDGNIWYKNENQNCSVKVYYTTDCVNYTEVTGFAQSPSDYKKFETCIKDMPNGKYRFTWVYSEEGKENSVITGEWHTIVNPSVTLEETEPLTNYSVSKFDGDKDTEDENYVEYANDILVKFTNENENVSVSVFYTTDDIFFTEITDKFKDCTIYRNQKECEVKDFEPGTYKFYFVTSEEGKKESRVSREITIEEPVEPAIETVDTIVWSVYKFDTEFDDEDDYQNDIRFHYTNENENVTIKMYYSSDNRNVQQIKDFISTNYIQNQFGGTLTNVAPGTYTFYLVASEEGKNDYTSEKTVTINDPTEPVLEPIDIYLDVYSFALDVDVVRNDFYFLLINPENADVKVVYQTENDFAWTEVTGFIDYQAEVVPGQKCVTIKDLPAGNYRVAIKGTIDGKETYYSVTSAISEAIPEIWNSQ